MKILGSLILTIAVCCGSSAFAEELNMKSYRQLQKDADFVLIVHPVSGKEVAAPPETDSRLTKMETVLQVLVPLKGEVESDKITFVHYVAKEDATELKPRLVKFKYGTRKIKFRTRKNGIQTFKQPHSQYLVFLKRHTDGKYEPASGQYDSITSVSKLSRRFVAPPPSNIGEENVGVTASN